MSQSPDAARQQAIDWVAVDWGTSHLRVWLMDRKGTVLERRTSELGMGTLTPGAFEPTLIELLGNCLPQTGALPVICCGMVGARQGWTEAGYTASPCPPLSIENAKRVACNDKRIDVFILPGIKQLDPPDVMRGEETQLAGLLAGEPTFEGAVCLPGTHSKWVRVEAGEVAGFRTFMTGELFALMSRNSVLKHCVAGDGWDDAAFETAVGDALSEPASITGALFAIRAASLLNDVPAASSRARLSGLLIGAELAASRAFWTGHKTCIIGESGIGGAYKSALEAHGADVLVVSGDDLARAGLAQAFEQLKDIIE